MTWIYLITGLWLLSLLIVLVGGYFITKKTWRRCAWCRRWISSDGEVVDQIDDSIIGVILQDTHGICPECARREMREFADQLSAANK